MLNIFEDYSGMLVSGPNRFPVPEIKMAQKLFLSFEVNARGRVFLFSGIVPLGQENLEGGIILDGKKVATWQGNDLKSKLGSIFPKYIMAILN